MDYYIKRVIEETREEICYEGEEPDVRVSPEDISYLIMTEDDRYRLNLNSSRNPAEATRFDLATAKHIAKLHKELNEMEGDKNPYWRKKHYFICCEEEV